MKAGALEKGLFILEKGAPYEVVEREFVNPGKGSSFVRLKLKNLLNASVLKITHKSQDHIEEIDVRSLPSQYLYRDGESYHLMSNEDYEQYTVPVEGFESKQFFMKEGESYPVVFWGERCLDIELPIKVDLVVTEAEEAARGDTVSGVTKMVKVETGFQVKVPSFIKEGDKIRINTETREYQERINS